MIDRLLEAADSLAMALEQENAALARLDLAEAAGCLAAKERAAAAFSAAQAALASTSIDPGARARAIGAGKRLTALARDNRQLLERGLVVQARVIGVVARAAPRAIATNTTGYRSGGTPAGPCRSSPMALSAHA